MTKLTHENKMKRQQRDKIVESNRIWSIEVLTQKKKEKKKERSIEVLLKSSYIEVLEGRSGVESNCKYPWSTTVLAREL